MIDRLPLDLPRRLPRRVPILIPPHLPIARDVVLAERTLNTLAMIEIVRHAPGVFAELDDGSDHQQLRLRVRGRP